ERLGCDRHCSVVADGALGRANVVVDSFGNADELDAALLSQSPQDAEAAVAAHADQGMRARRMESLDDLLGSVTFAPAPTREREGITFVRGAQDGSTQA